MECRNCKYLSKPEVIGNPDNYPSVRCTLGLWDKVVITPGSSFGQSVPQWDSYGESQLNRGPVKRYGEAWRQGKSKVN